MKSCEEKHALISPIKNTFVRCSGPEKKEDKLGKIKLKNQGALGQQKAMAITALNGIHTHTARFYKKKKKVWLVKVYSRDKGD